MTSEVWAKTRNPERDAELLRLRRQGWTFAKLAQWAEISNRRAQQLVAREERRERMQEYAARKREERAYLESVFRAIADGARQLVL